MISTVFYLGDLLLWAAAVAGVSFIIGVATYSLRRRRETLQTPRSPTVEAVDLKSIKQKFESSRGERRYFSMSGIEIFPNDRDKLWLDWLDFHAHGKGGLRHDQAIRAFLLIYPADPA